MRYVAAHTRDGVIDLLGYVLARDVSAATFVARRRWPDCGVMPWSAYKRIRRAQLALSMAIKEPVT